MWLTQWTLLLLSVMVVSGDQQVFLDGRKVDALIGSSLILHCLLETEAFERFVVKWFFVPLGSSNITEPNISSKLVLPAKSAGTSWREWRLTNVSEEMSGWYFCLVRQELPLYSIIESNRTKVVIRETSTLSSVVTEKPGDSVSRGSIQWWVWPLVGVSALTLLLLLLLLLCVSLRGRCSRDTAGDDPVYANTHRVTSKQASPRPPQRVSSLKSPAPSQPRLSASSAYSTYTNGQRRVRR